MTKDEAIKTLKANYPDACFEELRNAVDMGIKALKVDADRVVIIVPDEFDVNILKKIFKDLPTIHTENETYCGCEGCAFWDKNSWDMPCKECKRNCTDYWRKAKDDE